MNQMLIESVLLAFTLGGIIGAAVTLLSQSKESHNGHPMQMEPIPIKNRHKHQR